MLRMYRRILVIFSFLTIFIVSSGALVWAQEASPSPDPSPTSSPSPSPSDSPSPSPSESASPTPSEPPSSTPAPELQAQISDLFVTVSPQGRLAQVGDRFRYKITVANNGGGTLEDVVLRHLVAEELTVVGVPILEEVEAINLGRFGDEEDITWVLGDMGPGDSFVLPWLAKVKKSGDFVAGGSITVSSGNEQQTFRPRNLYLASVKGLRVVDEGRRFVTRRVVQERSVTLPADDSAVEAGTLPATGASGTIPYALVAAGLIGGGALLLVSPRKRSRALVLVALLLLTACVDDGPNGDSVDPNTPPEVKGRVIERDDTESEEREDAGGQSDEGRGDRPTDEDPPANEDEGRGSEDGSGDEDAQVSAGPAPTTVQTVREVRTVRIPVEDLPVSSLGATTGDNAMSLDWSETDGVRSALSSIQVGSEAPVSLRTGILVNGKRISVEVTLWNESKKERVEVSGRILHEVAGLAGGSKTLSSEPIAIVLAPGAKTVETFVYTLPTGNYTLTSRFIPN